MTLTLWGLAFLSVMRVASLSPTDTQKARGAGQPGDIAAGSWSGRGLTEPEI